MPQLYGFVIFIIYISYIAMQLHEKSCHAGPLLRVPQFQIAMIRWCAMHIIHLGCDLWIVGNSLRTLLLDTCVWGDGCDDDRLLNGWLEFKQWARENKWQSFSCDFSLFYLCFLGFVLTKCIYIYIISLWVIAAIPQALNGKIQHEVYHQPTASLP